MEEIPRCPDCNLISFLKLEYKDKRSNISYECENCHKGIISLEDYLNKYKNHSLYNEKCENVEKQKKMI